MKTEDADARRVEIIEAAQGCFFQYGFARTRMEDIARSAAISRPNLYNFFPNKEAIFIAVGEHVLGRSLERARAGLGQEGDVWERLFAAFEGCTVLQLEMVHSSPHASELLGAVSTLAKPMRDSYYEQLTRMMNQALRRAVRNGEMDLASAGMTAASAADMLVAATSGFKSEDMQVEVYRKRLRTLIDMFRRATSV